MTLSGSVHPARAAETLTPDLEQRFVRPPLAGPLARCSSPGASSSARTSPAAHLGLARRLTRPGLGTRRCLPASSHPTTQSSRDRPLGTPLHVLPLALSSRHPQAIGFQPSKCARPTRRVLRQNRAEIRRTGSEAYCFPSIPKRLITRHQGLEPKNGP